MAAVARCAVLAALLSCGIASFQGQFCSSADDCGSAEGPRAAGALLQSQSSTKAVQLHAQAPLQGRITTAVAEVASLQDRVEGIMTVVGVSAEEVVAAMQQGGDKAGANVTKKIDTSALYARYKELLHKQKEDESALKDDIAALEADCSALSSNILLLENQVQSGSSLLAKKGAESITGSPTSLSSRVEDIEANIEDYRTRVTSLEQVVVGLQMKSNKSKTTETSKDSKAKKEASLLEVGAAAKSMSKTGLGPLSSRLTALEKEVESLQHRSSTLENEIQGGGAVPELVLSESEEEVAAPPAQKPHRHAASLLEQSVARADLGEGTIKDRTAALETSVAALKSKMAMLENEAVGRTSGGAPSLLQVSDSGSPESLKARISSLEDEVDSLRTRVSTLEHVVEG